MLTFLNTNFKHEFYRGHALNAKTHDSVVCFFFAHVTLNACYAIAFTGAGDSYFVNKSDTSTNDHYLRMRHRLDFIAVNYMRSMVDRLGACSTHEQNNNAYRIILLEIPSCRNETQEKV